MNKNDELEQGEWYQVEIVVPTTKKLTGKLMRKVNDDGGVVYIFEGRLPFAIEADKIVSVKPTSAPKTGVRRATVS